MANWSGFNFGGFDPILSWGTTGSFSDWLSGERGYQQALAGDQLVNTAQLQMWQAKNMPKYQREGLEAAGYNPLLAVGSASPSVGGSTQPLVQGSGGSSAGGNPLDFAQRAANVRLTEAQTKKVQSETGVNAWKPAHFSSSEAMGLGGSILNGLGLHVNVSESDGYTLFVNPVTKEILNPQTGRVVSFGHANSAQDVKGNKAAQDLIESHVPVPKEPVGDRVLSSPFLIGGR